QDMSLKIQRPVGLFSGKNDLVLLHLVSSCRQPEVQKPISFFPLHTPSFLRFNEFSKLNPSGHFDCPHSCSLFGSTLGVRGGELALH
ncbi:MAG: hypothetical protein Q8P84_04365, partial [Deltaproteobacteria bacterium]|nr:hypothetical protein [Deltaproteobacteria bacterium]